MTVERIAIKIKKSEKGQIIERRRNGTAQIQSSEVEGDDSVWMAAAAANGGPVEEGVGGIPITQEPPMDWVTLTLMIAVF